MPGIGRINLGTLLSEASEPLSRRDYEGLGHCPVPRRVHVPGLSRTTLPLIAVAQNDAVGSRHSAEATR